MNPLFSIIIPVYKTESSLRQCVKSVLQQSEKDFEVILIDDGSPDFSGKMCDQFALEDDRVRVVHKKNGGVSSARNAGLEVAKAEYVIFLDSDDYIDSTYLSDFVDDDSDLVVSSFVIENESKDRLHLKNINEKKYYGSDNPEYIEEDFIEGIFNYACTKRFKRRIIERYKIRFSEELNISEDTLFVVKYLCHTNSVAFKNTHKYHYVKYDHETLSNQKLSKSLIRDIERANFLICEQLRYLFGEKSNPITAARIMTLYRNYLIEITNSGLADKDFLYFLFKQYWFRQVIARKDFIPNENWKYRIIIKSRSSALLWAYIRIRQWKNKY